MIDWINRTSFNPEVKTWSYSKVIEVFGEDKGKQVAEKFGIKKKATKKKTTKKSGE